MTVCATLTCLSIRDAVHWQLNWGLNPVRFDSPFKDKSQMLTLSQAAHTIQGQSPNVARGQTDSSCSFRLCCWRLCVKNYMLNAYSRKEHFRMLGFPNRNTHRQPSDWIFNPAEAALGPSTKGVMLANSRGAGSCLNNDSKT